MMLDDSPHRLPMVRVVRLNARGWHWINASDFDPARHELMDDDQAQFADDGESEGSALPVMPKRRGRPSKQETQDDS